MTDEGRIGDTTQTSDFEEVSQAVKPIVYRHAITGEEIQPSQADIIINKQGKIVSPQAPQLSEEQLAEATQQVGRIFDAVSTRYPRLAHNLQRNPTALAWLPELQLSLSNPRSPLVDSTTDLVSEVSAALLEQPSDPNRITLFNQQLEGSPALKTFWAEFANKFDAQDRVAIPHIISSVSEEGAEMVAAEMIAWVQEHGLDSEENKAQALMLLAQKTRNRQQTELGDQGLFGILDAPQELFEMFVTRPLTKTLVTPLSHFLSTPDERALAKHMSYGQELLYSLGVKPSYDGWGLFEIASGAADAWSEFVDPTLILAEVGSGLKAIKTLPVAAEAVEAGRLATVGRTLRAFLAPRRLSGFAKEVRGGRIARAMYAFKPRTVEKVLDNMVKTGVAEDMMGLLKAGEFGKFADRYPQFSAMTGNMMDAIAKSNDPQMAVEVLKAGAINDFMLNPGRLDDAEKAAATAWSRVADKIGTDAKGVDVLKDVTKTDDLVVDAIRKQSAVDAIKAEDASDIFYVADVPNKIPRSGLFSYDKLRDRNFFFKGRTAQTVRRFKSRAFTASGVDDAVNVYKPQKGAVQLRRIFQHYGMDPERIDDLVGDFLRLNPGEHWDWMTKTAIPAIGDELGIPVLQYNLVELFERNGLRRYATGDVHEAVDSFQNVASEWKSMPIMSRQLVDKVPIPIDQIDAIVKRYNKIPVASRAAKAIGLRGKGWLNSTKKHRADLVEELRAGLKTKGVDVSRLDNEDLYEMAYSMVSPNEIFDGRGVVASKLMPALGSPFQKLHSIFTQSMLVLRPGQWALRVGSEEELRGFMFNLPSLYRNPIKYGSAVKEAWLVHRMERRSKAASRAALEIQQGILGGAGSVDEAVDALKRAGLYSELVQPGEKVTLGALRARLGNFLSDAVSDKSVLKVGDATRSAVRALKKNQEKVTKAKAVLRDYGMADDFSFFDDAADINGTVMRTYLGREISTSAAGRRLNWGETASPGDLVEYGQGFGKKLSLDLEDWGFRMAVKRWLAKREGLSLTAQGLDGRAIASRSKFDAMAGVLRQRFADVGSDTALAEKWMDEILEVEARRMIEPLIAGMNDAQANKVLRELATTRRYRADLGGIKHDIDLEDNLSNVMREFGQLVKAQQVNASYVKFPKTIFTDSFDARFMDESKSKLTQFKDQILHLFGEDFTQVFNRRPAYMFVHKKWYDRYKELGVGDDLARQLAGNHAAEMVNHVYFNSADAPFIVQKLNKYIPFFNATYEVMGTWAWKMPNAVGGYWPFGIAEFGRKMQRFMDGLVTIGLVTRVEEEDGSVRHVINLGNEVLNEYRGNPIGEALGNMGLMAIKGISALPAHLASIITGTDVDALYENGMVMEVGNPINPFDYGLLSYAQANVGAGPHVNFLVHAAAPLIGLSVDTHRVVANQGGETLQSLADRLDVDPMELARMNRNLLFDEEILGSDGYDLLLDGKVIPDEVRLPGGTAVVSPEGSAWDTFSEFAFPFGPVDNLTDLPIQLLPGILRYGVMSAGIAMTPTDQFYTGEWDKGLLGMLLPEYSESQVSGMLAEAFMYVESHDVDSQGRGPFTRIQEKKAEIKRLVNKFDTEDIPEVEKLQGEVTMMEEDLVSRVKGIAAGGMGMRMFMGQFMPTSPYHMRKEHYRINSFWESRDYADKLKEGGLGIDNIQPFSSKEELDNFFELVGAWLNDNTGDDAKAVFLQQNPTLPAYLTGKTFWTEDGVPAQVESFEERAQEIADGRREGKPLAVMFGDYRVAQIQANSYIKTQALFGGETVKETAANIIQNYDKYDEEIAQPRREAFDALYMEDDMNGGEYLDHREQFKEEEDRTMDLYLDTLDDIRDTQSILMDSVEELDSTFNLNEIIELRKTIGRTIGVLGSKMDEFEALSERTDFNNPLEATLNRYWKEYYEVYNEEVGALYDELDDAHDKEAQSLIFEKIKLFNNKHHSTSVMLDPGDTTPFPNALDLKWKRKDPLDKEQFVLQRITNPLEWLDIDGAKRIVEQAPHMAAWLPETADEQRVYQEWTLRKIEISELYEQNAISWGDRNKLMDLAEEQVVNTLLAEGRGNEVEYLHMLPIEKLYLADMLPPELGTYVNEVRFYKEQLDAAEESPSSTEGRIYLDPFYQRVKAEAFTDPSLGSALDRMGTLIYDNTNYDELLPLLFFGSTKEQ